MKINITKRIETTEEIDVEFPYYYEHYLSEDDGTDVVYGRITEKEVFSIKEKILYCGETSYEIEKEKYNHGFDDYFEKDSQSTCDKFEAVKERALKFLSDI